MICWRAGALAFLLVLGVAACTPRPSLREPIIRPAADISPEGILAVFDQRWQREEQRDRVAAPLQGEQPGSGPDARRHDAHALPTSVAGAARTGGPGSVGHARGYLVFQSLYLAASAS